MSDLHKLQTFCQDLATGTRDDQRIAWRQLTGEGKLWHGCQQAVNRPSRGALASLVACFEHFHAAGTQEFLRARPGAEAPRLAAAAGRVVAGALLAALAYAPAGKARRAELLTAWSRRAAAGGPTASAPGPDPNLREASTPAAVVRACFAALAGQSAPAREQAAAAQDAALSFLRARARTAQADPSERRLRLPVLLTQAGTGRVAWLWLESFDETFDAFYQAPGEAFTPLGADLREALAVAWERVARRHETASGRHVRWWLVPEERNEDVFLDGSSLQATAEVGLTLLLRQRPYDPACFVTATVDADGRLGPVNGVLDQGGAKLGKALALKPPHEGNVKVVISPDNLPAETARLEWQARGLTLVPAADLDAVCECVSGLATGLREFLRTLRERPDQQPPPYLGERRLSALYVSPDVWKCEPAPHGAARRRGGPETVPEVGPAGTAAGAQDVGDDWLYREPDWERARRVPWEEEWQALTSGTPRCTVLLAPPGQGKSLLAQMAARQRASVGLEYLARQQVGVDVLPLALVVSLPALSGRGIRPGESAEEALRAGLRATLREQGVAEGVADYLSRHAHEERTWLFLDALDEVGGDGDTLKRLLTVLAGWRCRVLLTSRPHACQVGQLPFEAIEYRLAPLTTEQVQDFVRCWFPDGDARARMLDLLRRSPCLRQVSQSPFLLTLLCWVGERRELPSDLTRARLYERMVRDMLGLAPGGNDNPVDEQRAEEWLPALVEVARQLFVERAGRGPLPAGRLLELLAESPCRPLPAGLSPAQAAELGQWQQASALLAELVHKRLLAPLGPDRAAYTFPHRSLLEFLAARAFADLIEGRPGTGEGRGGVAAERPGAAPAWDLLDRKVWDPDWEQVLLFLAGALTDPGRLLELLADTARDDHFRHRLALAAQCLAEIPARVRARHTTVRDRIATTYFALWWRHQSGGTVEAVPYRTRVMALLGEAQVEVYRGALSPDPATLSAKAAPLPGVPAPLVGHLTALLADSAAEVRRTAVEGLGLLESAAATPEVLRSLIARLGDEEELVRSAAVESLEALGRAATPAFLDRLADLLRDADGDVRQGAAAVAGGLGSHVTPAVLGRLVALLGDIHGDIRGVAVRALGRLGSAAATPDVVEELIGLLEDGDGEAREDAAQSLGALAGGVTPALLPRLAALLRAPSRGVQFAAVEAVGGLGAVAARSVIVRPLLELLCSRDWEVQSAAARALGRLGIAAASPEVVARLGELLADADGDVQRAACEALRGLGPAAARPELLGRLTGWLGGADRHLRRLTVEVLGTLGPAAATPEVCRRLVPLLRDADREVQQAAAVAVGHLGRALATPEFLAHLGSLLEDRDGQVRATAARAVGGLGSVAVTPVILLRLAALLRDGERPVWRQAIEATAGLGSGAATPEILAQLTRLLGDGDGRARRMAAEAVACLGSVAATSEVRTCLAALLGDEDRRVRGGALEAVRNLGPAAAAAEVMARLSELLGDADGETRSAAAEAVFGLGAPAATPPILGRLTELLRHADEQVRATTARAVGGLGGAVTPPLLAGLAELLHDADARARRMAARAFQQLLARRVRVFVRDDGIWQVRTVAELSRSVPARPPRPGRTGRGRPYGSAPERPCW